MNNFFQLKSFIFYFLIISLSLGSSSCSKDEKEPECTFPSLSGKVTFNGVEESLSVAQLSVSSGGSSFGDTYSFQVSSVGNGCNEQKTVSINVNIPSGAKLGGTYPIKTFFDSDINEAFGNYIKLVVDPVSTSSLDLISGTLKVTNHNNNEYTLDLNAKTATNQDVKFVLKHKF